MRKKKTTKAAPMMLADVLGIKTSNPYTASNLEEYKQQISKLNLLDLQEHAVTVGLRPSSDRGMLEKTLINLFRTRHNELYALLDKKNVKTKSEKTIYDIINNPKKKK
jgi:hypothetical protein